MRKTSGAGPWARFLGELAQFGEEDGDDDVAHAKAGGGEGWAAEGFNEFVIAAATGDGTVFAAGVGDFPDKAGVVGQAADDGGVVFRKPTEAQQREGFVNVGLGAGDG